MCSVSKLYLRFIRDFPCRGPPDGGSPAGQVLYKSL
nr:MAG TPA: hypothetical protein [Caudoviricetes sp.]